MSQREQVKVDGLLCEIIVSLHIVFDDYQKIALWLRTENLNFGGKSPLWLIQHRMGQRVMDMIDDALGDGSSPSFESFK